MKLKWSVLARNREVESLWTQQVQEHLQDSELGLMGIPADILLVDPLRDQWQADLCRLDIQPKLTLAVIEDGQEIPPPDSLPGIDDFLVYPFRLAEVLSKTKLAWSRIQDLAAQKKVNDELRQTTAILSQYNQTLENILKVKTPKRFTGIKGLNVMSRHHSGLKPGGDYFDIFESERKDFVNILLADSSSYGLSSALLGMILSSSARMASDANMSVSQWIQAIYKELKVSLGEGDALNVFFGRLDRRDFSFHYQWWGSIEVFLVDATGKAQVLERHGDCIRESWSPDGEAEKIIVLHPQDRLVILSDGFVRGVGGVAVLRNEFLKDPTIDPFRVVNELSYQIKSKLVPGETFPGEDCSAIVIDVEKRVLRLAPVG